MNEAQLVDYITQQVKSGVSADDVDQALVDAGYHDDVIDHAFAIAEARYKSETPSLFQSAVEKHDEHHSLFESAWFWVTHNGLFRGRLDRSGFLIGVVVYAVLNFITGYIVYWPFIEQVMRGETIDNPTSWNAAIVNATIVDLLLFSLPMTIIFCSMLARRLHDRGRSGWLALCNFVPVVAALQTLLLLILPGSKEANAYGQSGRQSNIITIVGLGIYHPDNQKEQPNSL